MHSGGKLLSWWMGMALGLAAFSASAATGPLPSASDDPPVLLTAAQMDYDRANDLVIAQGKVEVVKGDNILLADTLTYDRANNLVFAQGNVSMLEPSGNVYFADELQLTDDMKEGTIQAFKARLADGSVITSASAERVSEQVTTLLKAVYSPCSVLCKDGTPKTPLWQVRAGEATLDKNEEEITYRNAYVDLYGVPVLYTPYLSHAAPGAENKSGLLMPSYKRSSNLGTVIKLPFYWAIAPDRDLTLTPASVSKESPLLFGQYRQMYDSGQMKIDFSATDPGTVNGVGKTFAGTNIRGHIFGQGDFVSNENWQWGFNVRRTSDDTYLRRYEINSDPLLTSRVYGEGYDIAGSGRSYVVAQALAFQGLQQQTTPERTPFVLPLVTGFYQTDPLFYNSRLTLSGGAQALTRESGSDSRRLSMAAKWQLPYITDDGHIFEVGTQLRGDAYDVTDAVQSNGANFSGQTGRVVPQVSLGWRYPLIRPFGGGADLTIEPVINAVFSPKYGNPSEIPNEDSAVPEFTDSNLFSDNRFAGYDRIETGPRVSYGIRSQLYFNGSNAYMQGLFGQAWRLDDDPLFPFSNTLDSHFSDYVGMVGVGMPIGPTPVDISYRFRLDRESLDAKRSEVAAGTTYGPVSVGLNFLEIRNDPILASQRSITGGSSLRLNDNWTLSLGGNYDLLREDAIGISTGLTYQNECIALIAGVNRDLTSDRDFRQSTSVNFQVLLRNLE